MKDLCVVFDVDDTLYLESDYVMSGFAAAGTWARTWAGIDDFAAQCEAAFCSGQRGRIFNTVLANCGVDPKPELVSALLAIYRSHPPNIRLCDDAADALKAVSERWPVAVITDGPAVSQSRKAEALQLSRFASPVFLTELFGQGCSKPSPVAFKGVQQAAASRRYAYVADNPLKDFTAPLQLGWTTIRIRRPGGLHSALPDSVAQPHFEFPDCAELARLFANLV